MNTRYFTSLAVFLLGWSLTGCFAPSTINNKARNYSETDDKIISAMKQQGLISSKPYYLNEINSTVVRNFISTYRNATEPRWVEYSRGYLVYFISDSIQHRVYYTRMGDRQCIIRQYSEKNLPREIRHMVKSVYYDYSIFMIHEVTIDSKTSYVIKIEDKTWLKEIKIENGEMEVVREFIKSK